MPAATRIECPHCQALVPAHIEELLPRAVRFRCGECKQGILADSFAAARETANEGNDPSGPHCPKCKAALGATDQACTSCGLAVSRFADFQASQQELHPRLADAWSVLCADWDRDELHEAFLAEVARSGAYGEAARRYRLAADEPSQKARAHDLLARIRSMAAAALLSSPPKVAPADEPFKGVLVLLIVLVAIAGAGGVYAMMKSNSHATPSPVPTGRPGR